MTPSAVCSAVFTESALLTVSLGTDKNEQRSFRLYPNPTSSAVYVDYDDVGSASVIVWDINGRLIKSQLIQNSGSSIDLSDLASGVYLFKVTTANGSTNKKVIKK